MDNQIKSLFNIHDCISFQYESEEQDQRMTDLKLKNEKDRIDMGMEVFIEKDCSAIHREYRETVAILMCYIT
jgi:hypothetical protein